MFRGAKQWISMHRTLKTLGNFFNNLNLVVNYFLLGWNGGMGRVTDPTIRSCFLKIRKFDQICQMRY